MRKKIIAIMLIIFCGIIFGAESSIITKLNLEEDRVSINIDSEKYENTINFDEGSKVIFIEFLNAKLGDKVIVPDAKNNQFIDKLESITFDNNLDIFITLKKDIFYKAYNVKENKTLSFEFYRRATDLKKPSIVIDAGHGGKDGGASGVGGLREKDIALKVVKMLRERLKEEFNITLTRDDDYFIPLPDRPKVANDINADLFISVHLNAFNSDANGVEVFYYSRNESAYARKISSIENSVDEKFGIKSQVTDIIVNDLFYKINQEKSAIMSTLCVDYLVKYTGFNKRPQGGVYGANFAVLRGSKMPSVLIELGFLTNKIEAPKLNDEEYQKKMVEAIYEALKKYFTKG